MITIFSRENCAYCPMVKKYLEHKGVKYEEKPAEGQEYEKLSALYGFTVPLVWNGKDGMVGYSIPRLNQLIETA